MQTPQNIKRTAPQLTPPCPPRPPLLQTRSLDIDQSVDARRLAAGRAADEEARAKKAASDRARREATRLGVAGGTVSASGAGGGGTEALDPLLNHDDEIVDVSAVASSLLRSSRNPDVDDRRRAASAIRSARLAAAVVRGAPRNPNIDPNYRGRLRISRPSNAPVGPSPILHTGLSVDSALPSSTPSSATIRYHLSVGSPHSQVSISTPPPHPPLPRVKHQSENVILGSTKSERFAAPAPLV